MKNPTLQRWAGTPGVIMVVRDGPTEPWYLLGSGSKELEEELVDIETVPSSVALGKRPSTIVESDLDAPNAKRLKHSTENTNDLSESSTRPCVAPPRNPIASQVLHAHSFSEHGNALGTGDLFLTDGFRERWCHCDSVGYSKKPALQFCLLGLVYTVAELKPVSP